MAVLRKLARPMLASIFVSGGYATLRHPEPVAPIAEPVAMPVAERIKGLPQDPQQLVRINSAVQLGAGSLLALGRFPRSAALALAVTLLPTTLAGHPYWTIEDPEERSKQRIHFYKNLSMMGGLLLAAADTHGKPSLAYRTRQGTRHATEATAQRAQSVAESFQAAADSVTDSLHAAADSVGDSFQAVADSVTDGVKDHLPVGPN